MALQPDFEITAVQADCSTNTLTDTTVYGNGEAERHTLANFVIAAKMDIEGTPSYLGGGVNNYNLVTTSSLAHNTTGEAVLDDYIPSTLTFPTSMDGWYQFIVLSFKEYDQAGGTYVGTGQSQATRSLVYYDSGGADEGFYYCIADNDFNDAKLPSDTGFWVKLSTNVSTISAKPTVVNGVSDNIVTSDVTWDDNAMLAYVDNTTLEFTHQHDDLVTCYGEDCLTKQLEKAVDDGLCKDCTEPREILKYQRLDVLINGALAKNYHDKMAEAEEIMRFVEDFCSSC